jgi:hypothetical protein
MTAASDIDLIGKSRVTIFKQVYNLLNEPSCPYKNDLSPTDVQDELGRLKIWNGNIREFRLNTMRSSVEHRLQDASKTRSHLLNLTAFESHQICPTGDC